MKSAGKARNNGLYRHIRTSKEIIRNLLNDFCEHYNVRNGNCFLPCVKYKSYYHCFTAIKFAKPS